MKINSYHFTKLKDHLLHDLDITYRNNKAHTKITTIYIECISCQKVLLEIEESKKK